MLNYNLVSKAAAFAAVVQTLTTEVDASASTKTREPTLSSIKS